MKRSKLTESETRSTSDKASSVSSWSQLNIWRYFVTRNTHSLSDAFTASKKNFSKHNMLIHFIYVLCPTKTFQNCFLQILSDFCMEKKWVKEVFQAYFLS